MAGGGVVRPLGVTGAGRRRLPGRAEPQVPRSVPVLVAGLAAFAVAAAWWAGRLGEPTAPLGGLATGGLVVALVAAGCFHVEYRHGDDDVDALDLFEVALAPTLLLLPATAVVLAVVVAKTASEWALHVRPLKAAFNVAAWAAAAAAGSVVLGALGGRSGGSRPGTLVALVAAMVVVALVNQASFVTVLRLAGRRTFGEVLAELRPAIVPAWLVGGSVILASGVLFAAACAWDPALAWLLPAPLVALHRASQGYAARRSSLARTAALHRASRDLAASPGAPGAVATFLEEVRGAFGASAAHLVEVVDGIARVEGTPATGDGAAADGRPDHRLAVALAALERPDRVTVLSDDPRVASGLRRQGWRDALVAPLPTGGPSRGALCVFDPKGVVSSDDAEVAVLEGLAAELGSALAGAEAEAALRRSEARFRTLVEEASDMVVVTDAGGVVADLVPRPSRSPVRACPGAAVRDLAHPDDAAGVARRLSHLAARPGATEAFTWRAPGVDGGWRHLETMATNLLDDPAVAGIVLISRDVSERVLATELLAGQAEALGRISRGRPLAETVESLGRTIRARAPGARLSVVVFGDGGAAPTVHGSPLAPPLAVRLSDALASREDAGAARRPVVVSDVSADPSWPARADSMGAAWAAPITRSDGSGALGMAVVTFDHRRAPGEDDVRVLESVADLAQIAVEAVSAEARLVHQATHDPLTGLPNRVLFLDRSALAISRLARSQRSVAVLFVDLDRFKTVNDSLGHDVGDRLLIDLARRLEMVMRPTDTVARFGGDEFTILCEDLPDGHEAAALATRVREALAVPVELEGHHLYVTASVGIAQTSDPTRPPHELVEEADAAMYDAKASGGDVHRVYDQAVRSRAMLDIVTYQALREAIDRGELRVWYQPTVDLATGRLVGAEALLRWDHPELGIVGPDEFIPLAEQTGLIVPIGALVLEEACAQRQRWAGRADADFAVSVNLSPRQFADPGLADTIAAALGGSGGDPSCLVLEITESALMEHADTTMTTLRTLHHLGVRIAIDDFGTGYSSLTYLKRFPVDALKVDRSFVAGLGADPDDEAIVGSVIDLAHNLGIVAVAEGVETDTQVALLQRMRCDAAQGYRFSRPVPADEVCFEHDIALDLSGACRE
jgi:diguanylate cyclase (GGDEF)-like protein/PAS domain S-box-containing protein